MAEGLPNRLRELRDARGWTLRDLGMRSGIDFNALSRMERGDQPLDTDRMRKLANVFGVKMSELLSDDDVEFRVDERSMELLHELKEVPEIERPALLVAAREVMRVARHLAALSSSATLKGDAKQITQLSDIWNEFDDRKRDRAIDLWRAAGLVE